MRLKKTIISIAIVSVSMLLSGCWETEKGEKVGNIVKLAKEGTFIKTNEAELIRGGMNDGSGSFGKPFDFTIEDERLLGIVQKALDEHKSVRVKYHKELMTLFRCESDNYFLDNIEIIK